ncbi:MAG: hypothetical protein EOP49_28630 [Sphingobacteriales bacterium]|nr:MAG: hypothetical protein EOP49_28630 [Sphingobacteriales bacterium]
MNTEQPMESRIWDFIDGNLNAEETSFVENLVQTNQEWRERYAELLQVHSMMNEKFELDEPSMSFTRNVMEEIGRLNITPATKKYINQKVIWGIGGFFILSLLSIVVYAFSQAMRSSGSESSLAVSIKSFDFGVVLNSTYTNIFLMVNTVLGLMLLDMYLGARKKKLQEQV